MGKYSIWVLDYAAVNKFPQSVMLYGPQYVGIRNLPYAYVLIKGQGQVILVDTGYDHKEYGKYLADLYGVSNWHPASEVLAECGVTPADVTTVFITHAHFDHMGGLDLFPNAKFYIQKREIDKWVWALTLGPEFRFLVGAADPADIVKATRLASPSASASSTTWSPAAVARDGKTVLSRSSCTGITRLCSPPTAFNISALENSRFD